MAKLNAGQLIEHLQSAPQAVAAWVCGLSPRSFRDRHAPRNGDGTYNIREVVGSQLKSAHDEMDLPPGPSDSPAMERWRAARADWAELDLAERRGQVVSVQLIQEAIKEAFVPLRRFAEQQIKEHGNGTADAWAEAVDLFSKELEGVIGKHGD